MARRVKKLDQNAALLEETPPVEATGTDDATVVQPALPPLESEPRKLGAETMRSHARRLREGFYHRYLSGDAVLDIGYRGGKPDAVPVTDKAVGIELDYPGYDGVHLPFPDFSQDAVFASHCLEHIVDWKTILADWFRVLKIGGYLVIAVPHQQLYERKADLPSRFNGNHQRFYTPASLMTEMQEALPVGGWRLRSLRDIDEGFGYAVPPEMHAKGCYEIELVIEKIRPPAYAHRLVASRQATELVKFFGGMVQAAVAARAAGRAQEVADIQALLAHVPLPSIRQLQAVLPRDIMPDLPPVMRAVVERAPFDEEDYLARYADIRRGVEEGRLLSGHTHYVRSGYFEGRFATPVPAIFA
jgi:SAM-dependent methyltransferase